MKKLFLLLILLAVSVNYSMAAADIDTKAGNKDLLFSFGGLNTLSADPFMGGIGLRYYISDGMAIRPELSFTLSSTKNKIDKPETKDTVTDFGINVGLEKHLTPVMKSLSPYVGLGAGVNFSKDKNEEVIGDPPAIGTLETKGTSFSIGVLGGFEWGFADGLALGGEYNIGVNIGTSKVTGTEGTTSTVTTDNSTFGFGINTAALMLSVHW